MESPIRLPALAIVVGLVAGFATSPHADDKIITTIVGNCTIGQLGDGGPAFHACLIKPTSVVADSSGNLFIADMFDHRIRRVDAGTGIITTYAGTGEAGFNGDRCPATDAMLNAPTGVALDAAGDLYISDSFNYRYRRVDATTGCIETIAGNGTIGFCGDNGPATDACLNPPVPGAFDSSGNLCFPDQFNNRIRCVDAITGIIHTVAGNGTEGYCGDGGPAVDACLNWPTGLAFDSMDNMCITDRENYRIRCVDAVTELIATYAGVGLPWYGGDCGLATEAWVGRPIGPAFDASDNMFFADFTNDVVRRVDAINGVIMTVAGNGTAGFSGDDGPATDAQLDRSLGVWIDSIGNMLIADSDNHRIRKVVAVTEDVDHDADSILNDCDNCVEDANPDQRDTNGDGFGNLCDADFNNDCIVNAIDLGLLKVVFFSGDADADINGDGTVNAIDLGLFKLHFFLPPGPSGVVDACDGL